MMESASAHYKKARALDLFFFFWTHKNVKTTSNAPITVEVVLLMCKPNAPVTMRTTNMAANPVM